MKRYSLSKGQKLIIFFAGIGVILILNHIYGWSDDFYSRYLGLVQNMVQEHFWLAALLYLGITVVSCVAFALPGITYAVFAGVLFGPWIGTLLCLLAATLGASIAFLIGRFFLKESLKPMIEKNRLLSQILFSQSQSNYLKLLMITRLVPLFPYNVQNFAYGITDVQFWPYTLYSMLFMLPGVAMMTIGSAGVTAQENSTVYLAMAATLLLAVLAVGYLLRKKYLPPHDHPRSLA